MKNRTWLAFPGGTALRRGIQVLGQAGLVATCLGTAGLVRAQTFTADTPILAAPEAGAAAVAQARAGATLRLLQRRGFWLEVESGTARGWVRVSGVTRATGLAALETGRTGAHNIVAIASARSGPPRAGQGGRGEAASATRLDAWRAPPDQLAGFAQEGALAAADDAAGRACAARLLGAAPWHASQDLQRYVNLVGGLLAAQVAGRGDWRFGVLDAEVLHTASAPGGLVLVTSGLIRQLGSEDELAAALAHEMAHVMHRHLELGVRRQLQADAGPASPAALDRACTALYTRGLEQAAEHEADLQGPRLMALAGYDPSDYLGMLERLDTFHAGDSRMALHHATHPSPKERIDHLVRAGIDRLALPQASAQVRQARFARVVRAAFDR